MPDVERIDVASNRDPRPNVCCIEDIIGEAEPFGSEDHGQRSRKICDVVDWRSIWTWCEGDTRARRFPNTDDEVVHRHGQHGKKEDLTHRDANAAPVVGVGARRVENQCVDMKGASTAHDGTKILVIAHPVENGEAMLVAESR